MPRHPLITTVLLAGCTAFGCANEPGSPQAARATLNEADAPPESTAAPIVAEASITIERPADLVFAQVVPIDLPTIFKGHWPLPAVVGTRDQTGPWTTADQTRTVVLSDDSTAQERLITVSTPHHFSYRVSGFTGVLGQLVDHANGQWWFKPQDVGADTAHAATTVRWQYAFVPRNRLGALAMQPVVALLWRPYMHEALAAAKQQVEAAP